ncbi:39S ribosomal protein L13, mitochondrial [Belonocnema kinseyi]|uniref:39S ribosomal protein L13, mitochondrial n=1 Tax=Belonocnema kinseyi TaxID=2817044 RepID=UPI00143D777F|nr:39S ribosomal protein L13, mitochondrial [Belonocnema kinseyi]
MSLLRKTQQWGTFSRVWHIYDAKWQDPFESAKLIKKYLMGLYKPIYHPMNDCGDNVVVINSKLIALKGDEWRKRVFFHHTGYHRGDSYTLAWELHSKDPTLIVKKAVYSSMTGNLQRRYTMQRLHIFPDENIPERILENVSNQIKQLRPVPVRLDHIPKEEVEQFPQLVKLPENYVVR